MAKFLTELDCHLKPTCEDVWILNGPLIFNSDIVGQVTAPSGFQTDLASVPRVPLIYSMWGARSHREAVIHDLLFRIDSNPSVTFNEANSVFLEAMTERGKSWYIRYPMYWGVCIGSDGSWHKRKVLDEVC